MADYEGFLDPEDQIGKKYAGMLTGKKKAEYAVPWLQDPNPIADNISSDSLKRELGDDSYNEFFGGKPPAPRDTFVDTSKIGDNSFKSAAYGITPGKVDTGGSSPMSQAIANKYQKEVNADTSGLLGGAKIDAISNSVNKIAQAANTQNQIKRMKNKNILDSWDYEVKKDAVLKERQRAKNAAEANFISSIFGLAGAGVGLAAGGPAGALVGGQIGKGLGSVPSIG